jgi:hypothetical protein
VISLLNQNMYKIRYNLIIIEDGYLNVSNKKTLMGIYKEINNFNKEFLIKSHIRCINW